MEFFELDGSYGEGGGQIVRTAIGIACLTQQPIKIFNIRAGREKPGLKAQHLHAIKALEQICNAKAEGARVGSTELYFTPGIPRGKAIEVEIGTAGSITLLLQAVLLPCCFADKKVKLSITGGTDTSWSPQYHYIEQVLIPQIKKYVRGISLRLVKRGYYPKGGGRIELEVLPFEDWRRVLFNDFASFWEKLRKTAPKINLTEQGRLLYVKGVSHASKDLQPRTIAERQALSARAKLKQELGCPVEISTEYSDTLSTGSGIALWAVFGKDKEPEEFNPVILGADMLGSISRSAERVGELAASKLLEQIKSGACVDEHLEDNLIPWMALNCPSVIKASKLTSHTRTNIYVVEKLFQKRLFLIDEKEKLINSAC